MKHKIPASINTPFGKIEFDYQKILNAENEPVNKEAINKFLNKVKKVKQQSKIQELKNTGERKMSLEVKMKKWDLNLDEQLHEEVNNFEHRLRGALMYKGGNIPEDYFNNISAHELFECCFRNGVMLKCIIDNKDMELSKQYGLW